MQLTRILTKKNISLLIFLFVNFIFSAKYLNRVSGIYIILSIGICLFYAVIWRKRDYINKQFIKRKISLKLIVILYFVFTILLLYIIPKETLNVDRWSVITSFWENYFNNKYVYYARSFHNNYPGPMPFYYILALPFYLLGELGLFSFCGILLFTFLGYKSGYLNKNILIGFILISTSLFYLWELSSRSNLFVNGTLVLVSIVYFFKKYDQTFKNNMMFGLFFGLLMSTRNVYAIPYFIAILYALRCRKIDFKNLIFLGLISLLVFASTFLPFVWNHSEAFMVMNPFIIQSSFLMPFNYTIGFVLLAVLFSFLCKKESDIYFYSGVVLFLTILCYFGYIVNKTGFREAFFGSRADVSYFILAIPFSIFYLLYEEQEKTSVS